MTQQPGHEADPGARDEAGATALDGNQRAQHLAGSGRGVRAGERIAARGHEAVAGGDHAVHAQPAVTGHQDDAARADGVGAVAANGELVAGPDGRQHARAGDAQAQFTDRAKHLRGQLALEGLQLHLCYSNPACVSLIAQTLDQPDTLHFPLDWSLVLK